MTTLVALSTRDSLVMGCDSLGSVTKRLVDPFALIQQYFDPQNQWKLKTDENGNPYLQNFDDVFKKSQEIPYNHMTHVTKLYSLAPLEMGIMTTGISSLGDRTIKSLISEFKSRDKAFNKNRKATNYTVKSVARRLFNFINKTYLSIYPEGKVQPSLEFMIGGYDKQKHIASIYRIIFDKKKIEPSLEYSPGIAFGGQMQEIQRIVFGTDGANRVKMIYRMGNLLSKYRDLLQKHLDDKKIDEKLPSFVDFDEEFHLFKDWDLDGFDANWADFSEQNAIECVNFFVQIMIKSQQFSSRLPTVGGNVHIALISKTKGFNFVSREVYEHEGYFTPIEG